ncbi:MAG: hypothetical protein ACM3US_06425 [Sphingomonadaceae bacterium]
MVNRIEGSGRPALLRDLPSGETAQRQAAACPTPGRPKACVWWLTADSRRLNEPVAFNGRFGQPMLL